MIFTYLKREENSLSSEVLPATQREIFIKLKANVVVLVNVLQLKLGISVPPASLNSEVCEQSVI